MTSFWWLYLYDTSKLDANKMRTRKFDTVCCADSAYGLFLYFLITGKCIDNTYFFFSKKVPKIYREHLQENGRLIKLPKTKIKLAHYLAQLYYFILIPFSYWRRKLYGLPVYGFDCMEWTNPILSLSHEFYLIEDGFGNYIMPSLNKERFNASWWRKFLVSKTNIFHVPFGISDAVTKIYLTGIMPIPKEIDHKTCVVSVEKLWNHISEDKKLFLLNFFIGERDFTVQRDRKILLLTQCFSEDKIMSEEQKIDIYSRVIRLYGENNIVLKTHPRESTDYKEIFPSLSIIDYPVPFQLLNLLGLSFEIAISVNSTAIFSLSNDTHKVILIPDKIVDIYDSALKAIADLKCN